LTRFAAAHYVRASMATLTGGLTTAQQMMTLAGLASTAATERPSGESVEDQQRRIRAGIEGQLQVSAPEWQVVWVGLTPDRANLAYVARNTTAVQEYAVVLRGTLFTSLQDLVEDLAVYPQVQFAAGGVPAAPAQLGKISIGAMTAFTETTSAVYLPAGTTLLEALQALIRDAGTTTPTIYVTGRSLGGATATTVALWLNAQALQPAPVIRVYTFAAPTAGDAAFASWFETVFPPGTESGNGSMCIWNMYDVVPNAWANLTSILDFYPSPPGPAAPQAVQDIVNDISLLGYVYAQPTQQPALNSGWTVYCQYGSVTDQLQQWQMQAGFQHGANTYLQLLSAPQIPSLVPTVTGVQPNSGPESGGGLVTITGTNFTSDCMVDFGIVRGRDVSVASDTKITVMAPPVAGIVDVTVTNKYGTSATSTTDQFTTPATS
jgi:Lipase (class 3)/IPT/TIG domain